MSKQYHFFLSARLAWQDLRNEFVLSLCMILSIMAVLAPLVVMAGLRTGVLTSIRQSLLENPHTLEIVNVANRSFTAKELDQLGQRPDIQFLIPRTRTLAASLLLEKPQQQGTGHRVMLVPTAKGDPLLKGLPQLDKDNSSIILSNSAAAALNVKAGDVLFGYLERILNGNRQRIRIPLHILTVAPASVTEQDTAYVTLSLAIGIENYQDGIKDWPNDLAQLIVPADRIYAGFRLYSRQLSDVPVLDNFLRNSGIDIVSRAGEVQGLLSLDRRLTILFLLVFALGGGGLLIALGAGLWANTTRKKKSLALLRFIGFSAFDLMVFPIVQASILSFLGTIFGISVAFGAGTIINHMFAGILPAGHYLFLLNFSIMPIFLFLSIVGGACLTAFLAGYKAAQIQPWEGITAL